jgi:hypothetical protein
MKILGAGSAGIGTMTLACLLGLSNPATGQNSRVGQPGTIGLTGGLTYGWISGDSRYGTDFDTGLGLTLGLRYVLNDHWSLGGSFFGQNFDATGDAAAAGVKKLAMTDIVFEAFYYRNRRASAAQYVSLGIGLYRPEIHGQGESEITFPSESLTVVGGLGAEVFIVESFGLELSGRAFGYFGDGVAPEEAGVEATGSFSFALQGQAGIIYYLLK